MNLKEDDKFRFVTAFVPADQLAKYREAIDTLGIEYEMEIESDVERRKARRSAGLGHPRGATPSQHNPSGRCILRYLYEHHVGTTDDFVKACRDEGVGQSPTTIGRHIIELAIDGYLTRDDPRRSGNGRIWSLTQKGVEEMEPDVN